MRIRIGTRNAVRFIPALIATLLSVAAIGDEPASAGTIDKIRADQTLRIAYREDAPPFSYKDANSTEPTGYMVHLCQAVAKKLADQLNIPTLKVSYVPVTAANRFEAIEKHDADLLCEATSATLSRRKKVDFSIATFADGAGLLTNGLKLESLKGLDGKKVGVLAGTTTEEALRNTLKDGNIQAEIVPAKTHDEGLAMLDGDKISAYFGDRSILMFLAQRSKAPDKLLIAEDYFTVEPYALALAHGDEDFRLAVDTALSHIYRSSEISVIFEQTFDEKVKPTDMIKALYKLSGLPD
jgi:ABC-type amino acid transport substrate-binding protein